MLVDDHILFAQSLAIALEGYEGIAAFYSTRNTDSLGAMVDEKEIDIVLMDINLGRDSEADGLELASSLLEMNAEVKILMLTGYDLPVYQHEAKKIGVSGFLNKDISPEKLVSSLYKVYNGGVCFPDKDSEVVVEELTVMEKNILKLICSGKKRKCIAQELYISERTLSNHLQHIFEKLGVSSAAEAIAKGIQLGYIPPVC